LIRKGYIYISIKNPKGYQPILFRQGTVVK